MKRITALLLGVAAILASLVALSAPAQAKSEGWEWQSSGREWGQQPQTQGKIPCDKTAKMCKTGFKAGELDTVVPNPALAPDVIDTAGNGFAMGVLPNYWTLCVANGYGPTVGGPVLSWNYPGRALAISLRNICTGYSITNRMTIDNINNSGACLQYANLGNMGLQQHWGPYYYIWNQNPIIFVNTRSGCNNAGGQLVHNAAKGVGYILGLAYGTCNDCVMGPDNNGVIAATNGDSLDANVIYQMP